MSSRRDTGFPGQQGSVLQNKISRGIIKAPVSTMGGEPSALMAHRSNKLGGGSKLEKTPLYTSIGEKSLCGISENQVLPDKCNSEKVTRRGTGFPGQGSRIPLYKTELGLTKPKKVETEVSNHPADSEITETADAVPAVDSPVLSRRRDTGMPTLSEEKSFFGGTRIPKVHGSNTNVQTHTSAGARKNMLPKIGEDVQHYRRSEWVRVKTKTKEAELSRSSPQKASTIQKLKSAAVSGRASMFSASRRIVHRISMKIFSEAAPEGIPGRMTAEDDLQLKEFTMEEVKEHSTVKSAWLAIHGRVYDVTNWMWFHPGGEEVLLEMAGKDATQKFESVFHSNFARDTTKKYVIGKIKGRELGDIHEGVTVEPKIERYNTGLSGRMTIFVGILAIIIIRAIILYTK